MKRILLLIILVILGITSQTEPVSAQITLRINIGHQPLWGPSGYDYVEYYYLPEIEAYYYVPNGQYIYIENGRWVTRYYLPKRYRGFDLYNAVKFVINEFRPYQRHDYYKSKYASHRDHRREISIRDSRDSRYFKNRNHPQYQNWKREEQRRKEYNRRNNSNDEYNRKRENEKNKNKGDNSKNSKKGRESGERRESRTR